MYEVGDRDRVEEIDTMPQASVGAPCPAIVCDEHRLLVAYYVETPDPAWDGSYVRVIDPEVSGDRVAVVEFDGYSATMFGPPNDEAFSGHPLASRGLRPYRAFEVHESSWVRGLERMNSVHPQHSPALFDELRHFVLAFHDSTFECVAREYRVAVEPGPLRQVVAGLAGRLSD